MNKKFLSAILFWAPGGGGYPKERVEPEQRNKKILDEVKKVTHRDLVSILKELDRDLVVGALSGEHFSEFFFANCKDETIAACVPHPEWIDQLGEMTACSLRITMCFVSVGSPI